MATRKMNMFEKLANMAGVLYRHQKNQFPRRFGLLTNIAKRELAPPKTAEWPVIKREFNAVVKAIESQAYKNYSVREAAVYAAVALEVVFWFFVGEMIGRRYIFGYLVPASFVSKETRKQAAALEVEDKTNF
ncbi:hypothetical protein L596_003381 [Steinernema carpocapsae]|uniref:ATP synthase subunit n=1 Tax=Steinernema carpocapsae TaxID=34508 RepID=A0A4U8UTY5_STECR|nr:hypothetical protein L596_003381 [Steinernema carpocapsae]